MSVGSIRSILFMPYISGNGNKFVIPLRRSPSHLHLPTPNLTRVANLIPSNRYLQWHPYPQRASRTSYTSWSSFFRHHSTLLLPCCLMEKRGRRVVGPRPWETSVTVVVSGWDRVTGILGRKGQESDSRAWGIRSLRFGGWKSIEFDLFLFSFLISILRCMR
jgi:hypothetical protein